MAEYYNSRGINGEHPSVNIPVPSSPKRTHRVSSRLICCLITLCVSLLIICVIFITLRVIGSLDASNPDQTNIHTDPSTGGLQGIFRMLDRLVYLTQKLHINSTGLMEKQTEVDGNSTLESGLRKVLGTLDKLVKLMKKIHANDGKKIACDPNWVYFDLSCYYVSSEALDWEESQKQCQAMSSHLVVINSKAEQNYVFGITKEKVTWLGLTDSDGTWKWVDGTPYESAPTFWDELQPDNNTVKGQPGTEDCANMRPSGLWNDDHCQHQYQYICERSI
ncbi:asialoglycoprotein receptor 1 isoform X1 [Xenopus laevis]|uniref:Asialoglycoprotein receptor 1 isoform X1 n=1 Tax=Xenopus laevis TaxID=8355 RepID=A0A8J0UTS0_XENLA|nr:asialoglycoprotein receptor 1 isoform X1 [Xenopus laevis]